MGLRVRLEKYVEEDTPVTQAAQHCIKELQEKVEREREREIGALLGSCLAVLGENVGLRLEAQGLRLEIEALRQETEVLSMGIHKASVLNHINHLLGHQAIAFNAARPQQGKNCKCPEPVKEASHKSALDHINHLLGHQAITFNAARLQQGKNCDPPKTLALKPRQYVPQE
ncbi:hypothetical protein BS47DRAFT_1367660 [Hydnum rufescens UP504]|uniref:Uncharacterized protein n=1 Tax=Hydnum rufescens UP504 TaxID=1448309 RepID=A0A9P6AIM1_9AGAM|nr:hypothetical protein BS47DRAFT_1367660 [Hydnum rufescens UP504]